MISKEYAHLNGIQLLFSLQLYQFKGGKLNPICYEILQNTC